LKKLTFFTGDWVAFCRSIIPKFNRIEPTKAATKTGPLLRVRGYVKKVYEHLNDVIGHLHATFTRQLNTGVKPDPFTVKKFARWAKPTINKWVDAIMADRESLVLDIQEELKNSDSWGANKKKLYRDNSNKTLLRTTPWDPTIDQHFYEAMVKVEEKYVMNGPQWLKFCLATSVTVSDRQRLVFVGKGEAANGLLTMMQKPLLRRMKKVIPGFCHSEGCTSMSNKILRNLRTLSVGSLDDLVSISTDGSNHDGHQSLSLIKAVDFVFWDALFKKGW
jgi:hypothetical protein